jgi:DNA-binding transcriptional ArsR family regulator
VEVDLALPAGLIGDPTRAAILLALSEQDALPASDLAQRAGVSNSTASIQLGKLVEGRLLEVERHGRHRYYRLAGPAVAEAIEALAVIAPARPALAARDSGIQVARTCYDHLAGALGVTFLDALVAGDILVRDNGSVHLSASGAEQLESLGVDVEGVRHSRRAFTKLCIDWIERRYHLAGGLGAALTSRLFELSWIERTGPTRAVRVTAAGRTGLQSSFGLELPA